MSMWTYIRWYTDDESSLSFFTLIYPVRFGEHSFASFQAKHSTTKMAFLIKKVRITLIQNMI